jgi:hypothetical protein
LLGFLDHLTAIVQLKQLLMNAKREQFWNAIAGRAASPTVLASLLEND